MDQSPRASGQPDPGRRDRIIDTALDVIAGQGVAGTSHRKVAAAAGVPLGSMTYYFTGMDELLREAFTRFADRAADRFQAAMRRTRTASEALDAVAHSITEEADTDEIVLTYELYTLAARDATFRDITERWMARNRGVLSQHLDPTTARLLDALIEGLSIHRALNRDPADVNQVVEGIRRITRS